MPIIPLTGQKGDDMELFDNKEGRIDFVKEAEKIINASYINTSYTNSSSVAPVRSASANQKRAKATSRIDNMLNLALFATGIAIVALLFLNLL